MSIPLPSTIEMSIIAATAITLSLAGMWLTRRVADRLGYDTIASKPRPTLLTAVQLLWPRPTRRMPVTTAPGTDKLLADLSHKIAALLFRKSARRRPMASHVAALAPTPLPQRLSIDAQWERTARVVNRAISGVHTVRAAHVAASEKLDAAQYAIEKLLSELDGIMSVKLPPAEIALFPRTSNVVSMRQTPAAAARVAA